MGRQWMAAGAAIVALMALPTGATAGTVTATDTSGDSSAGQVALSFQAAPSEANHLTVSVGTREGRYETLEFLDTGAGIVAGTGCNGGGPPGTPVTCRVHQPGFFGSIVCQRFLCMPAPGSFGVSALLTVVLGDGGSSFDGSSLSTSPTPVPFPQGNGPISMDVQPGAGNDTIETADGDDTIHPSPGDDTIETAAGNDTIRSSPGDDTISAGPGRDIYEAGVAPDGADDVNLGEGDDVANYGERQASVEYTADDLANDGEPGEGDRIVGTETFVTGPGDDTLVGGETRDELRTGAGDDLLEGRGGFDRLQGDAGDDRLLGGAGTDELLGGTGDDHAEGGEGADRIELDAGADTARAGADDDTVLGGEGDDDLDAGAGNDMMLGGPGADFLDAGDGGDRVLSGAETPALPYPFGPMENEPDRIVCGEGEGDLLQKDAFDRSSGCEQTVDLHKLEVFGFPIKQATRQVSAELTYLLRSPGFVSMTSTGLAPQSSRTTNEEGGAARIFLLEPRAWALRRLQRSGQVTVPVTIVFRPLEGPTETRHGSVHLIRPR